MNGRFMMQAPGYALDLSGSGAAELMAEGHLRPITGMPPTSTAITGTTMTSAAITGSPAIAQPIPEAAATASPAVTIGSRIRTLRRARGLTQDTLAVSTGVSRSAVAQWETGRAGQMGGKLRRIAEALGVSVSMLKDGWEGMATDSVVSAEEMSLLRLFRRCGAEDRIVLMHVAQKLGANTDVELPD